MHLKRIATLALSAGLGLICGCRSCFEISRVGPVRPGLCSPPCETCAAPVCSSAGCDAPCLEEGPALVPPLGGGGMMLPPPANPPLPGVVAPPPRLVPQATVQPYQPTGQPRLLSGLGQ